MKRTYRETGRNLKLFRQERVYKIEIARFRGGIPPQIAVPDCLLRIPRVRFLWNAIQPLHSEDIRRDSGCRTKGSTSASWVATSPQKWMNGMDLFRVVDTSETCAGT